MESAIKSIIVKATKQMTPEAINSVREEIEKQTTAKVIVLPCDVELTEVVMKTGMKVYGKDGWQYFD